MKIFNAAQLREIDAYTIKNEPVESIDLMERAARACFVWLRRRIKSAARVHVLCGPGNNGGDGLAVARMLAGSGTKVTVYRTSPDSQKSPDFALNEKRMAGVKNLHATDIRSENDFPAIGSGDLVIDAIFGIGLARPVDGLTAGLIAHVNKSPAVVIAIDLPSGLFADDNSNNNPDAIIRADYTLTFQSPKLAFLLASNDVYVGDWHVLDIGLHPDAIRDTPSNYSLLEESDIRALYMPRRRFAHKGDFGHALLVAGSYGKMGAAVLAARACLRSGAGLLSAYVPRCGYEILQCSTPETMCITDEHDMIISSSPSWTDYQAIGIGPGIGKHPDTQKVLKKLIQDTHVPLLLDADAINILAENPTWLDFLPPQSILTPHPKEFERLSGKAHCDHERFLKALDFSKRYNLILVLKGAYTKVISPDGRCWINSTGNSGMATAGSGDVLTGIILGWMAQGYSPLKSAIMSVYLHGYAGDLAFKRKGYEGLIAGDLLEMLPMAIKKNLGI